MILKVKFIVVSFENDSKHEVQRAEFEEALNTGWSVEAVYPFETALAYELRKFRSG